MANRGATKRRVSVHSLESSRHTPLAVNAGCRDTLPMASVAQHNDLNNVRPEPCITVPARAIVALAAGMIAAWFAAGSTGLLAHPLQHAITWVALIVTLLAAWPENIRQFGTWVILAVGIAFGLIFTASSVPTVNILAVAVVLAAVAQVNRGLTARVMLIVAIGAASLAFFRFACDSVATVWSATDGLGWLLGRIVGFLVGCPLSVGATYGGLDFLVLTIAFYVGWLICTPSPRKSRAIGGAVAIAAGHFAYLTILAYSEKFLALLPDVVLTPLSDINNVGTWTWSNGLRTLVPWNVPLLAMLIDCAIVAVMARGAAWLPVVEIDPEKLKKQKEKEEKLEVPGSVLARDMLFRFGPVLLAVAAALLGSLTLNRSDLRGKTVVAYDQGFLDWHKPEYDSPDDGRFGLLPTLIESLGGKFIRSQKLTEEELAKADVLLLIHPHKAWPAETLERIWNYVRGGGSLLLVAEPAIREGEFSSSFNDVLQPLSMEVRFDTAVPRVGNWEQSYEVFSHPAVSGIDDLENRFGIQLGSSIRTRWPARPVLVGRWGWSDPGNDAAVTGGSSYNAGKPLGDLVLAAEQPLGLGRVFVLGDTSPLQNDSLPNAFPFVGRLLGYLAHRPSSPQTLWRQILTLAAVLGLLALLAIRPAAWQTALSSAVFGIAILCCTAAGYWSGRVLPDGRTGAPGGKNSIAYLDASHLGAYDADSSVNAGVNHGVAELLRTLMRQGYLPLLTPDLTSERLERAGLAISIAPARKFSPAERAAVRQFVEAGGTFLCLVGAEESRSSASLLADFGFMVPPSPVAPGEDSQEPEPAGAEQASLDDEGTRQFRFYAAWPVKSTKSGEKRLMGMSDHEDWAFIYSRSVAAGSFVVIGDTHFASNENFQPEGRTDHDRVLFWRWLLSRVVPDQKKWDPSPASKAEMKEKASEEEAEEEE